MTGCDYFESSSAKDSGCRSFRNAYDRERTILELAAHLFETGKLSIGKAKELAGMTLWEFQHFLASRKIPVRYGIKDYREDIKTLKALKRIK